MGPAPAVAATRLAVRAVLDGPDPVLVACSGGPDSVALAAALAFEAPRARVRAGLVTVDHGLQPGSDVRAKRVVEFGRALGLEPVESVRVEVGRAGGPEGAARDARYAALGEVAQRHGARVLLGHTRGDQAETVLLGLGRGSGPRSIAGMRRTDGRWLRPFLGLDRATTLAACEAQALTTWDDPHNAADRFVRVRLRREVLPLLEDVLHGGVAASLARTADLLRDDLEALDAWADAVYLAATVRSTRDQSIDPVGIRPDPSLDHRGGGGLDVAALGPLPRAVRSRVLRRWAADAGCASLTREHLNGLDALVVGWHGQGAVALPGGVAVHRASGRLTIALSQPHAPQE